MQPVGKQPTVQRLNNRDVCPPDGFKFTHPETVHRSEAMDFYTWMERIRAHRTANNLPPVTEAEAEVQLCQQLGPEWCSHSSNNRPAVSTRWSFGAIWNASVAYAKLALGLQETVSREEANRRARICAGCYLNVTPQGCGACRQMADLITGEVAQKKTDYDAALQACAACGCPNKSLVHFPIEVLEEADPRDEKQALFPDFCWRNKGSENYLPAAA